MNRVVFKSESVEHATPKAVYEQLNAEFRFDFDPCPLGGSEDGTARLFCDWQGKRVFCNPPYGPALRGFLDRAHEAELAVYLIPARTDTKWFLDLVLPRAKEIRFIRGRLRFGTAKWNAPFPSLIAVFERGFSGPQIVTESRPFGKQIGGDEFVAPSPRRKAIEKESDVAFLPLSD